jgi:hypothetical protein
MHGRIAWSLHRELRRRAVAWAIGAALFMLGIYVGVLALANSLEHAFAEFSRLWMWMTPLLLGFSIQVGLFAYAHRATRGAARSRGVVASGGASTLSMVACCAHHLTDVLPLIGLAGVGLFFTSYQSLFLLLGVLSNFVGLVYMLGILRKHGLFPQETGILSIGASWPVERAFPYVLLLSAAILVVALIVTVF